MGTSISIDKGTYVRLRSALAALVSLIIINLLFVQVHPIFEFLKGTILQCEDVWRKGSKYTRKSNINLQHRVFFRGKIQDEDDDDDDEQDRYLIRVALSYIV